MTMTLDGTNGLTTPGVVNTAGETIATTLAVTGASTLTGAVAASTTLDVTGVSTFAAGTALLPALTTTGDTNTGLWFPAADTVAVSTGGTERMRIDSSGNVLVGTTGQIVTEKFGVVGTGTFVAAFTNNTNTSGYSVLRLGLNPNGNNTSSFFLQGNTNSVGNWYLFGNGTTSFTSDQRLKKNIETTRGGYAQDLCKLRVVKYNWWKDDDGTPKELGLIAQEVAQVFPNLVMDDPSRVSEDDDTVYKTLKQSVLPFMLLKAIQEQQALITQLQADVATLKALSA